MSKRSYRLGRVKFEEFKNKLNDTEFRSSLLDQYHLKMNLLDPLWCVAPSKFSKDREVLLPSVQVSNRGQTTLNIFGGSTSWGWGLETEESTLHSRLAHFCTASVRNYSQPAWNIFDSLTFIRRRPNIILDDSVTIFILGINEFHLSLTRDQDYLNTRGLQIIDRIGDISCEYYNAAPTWGNILQLVKNRTLQDLKFLVKSFRQEKKSSRTVATSVPPDYEERCFKILRSALQHIQEVMKDRPYIVYFEPSIFDKVSLNSNENCIVALNETRRIHWEIFRSSSAAQMRQNENVYMFSNMQKLGHYFDYCHPDKFTTEAIAEEICYILKRRGDLIE